MDSSHELFDITLESDSDSFFDASLESDGMDFTMDSETWQPVTNEDLAGQCHLAVMRTPNVTTKPH